MSRLESLLGIEELLVAAERRWPGWATADARLAGIPPLPRLRAWLMDAADPQRRAEVPVALARLASPDGGDEPAAAAVLAWLMVPAAAALLRRYGRTTSVPDLGPWLAAELWVQARSVPPTVANVPAHIKFRLAAGLRELVVADAAAGCRGDVESVAPATLREIDTPSQEREAGSDELVAALLHRAVASQVISDDDRQVLVELIAYAHAHPRAPRGRCGGLASRGALAQLRAASNRKERTVSRQVAGAIEALRVACRSTDLVAMATQGELVA